MHVKTQFRLAIHTAKLKELEMCHYDTDASDQGPSSPTRKYFENNEVEKRVITLITRAPQAGQYMPVASYNITKTRLFKYIENFITKKNENFQVKIRRFFIFLLKI